MVEKTTSRRESRGEQANNRTVKLIAIGLFLGMFSSALSMNVVAIAVPVIIADIGGNQSALTWTIIASAFALAISTPVWGKLADSRNKKRLMQVALLIFVVSAAFAGLAQDTGQLIFFRVVQGIGSGGIVALCQIILAEVVSARERGKYLGFMNSVLAASTLGGPLLGGLVTDTLGWRWNFYLTIPIILTSILMLQRYLKLPTTRRPLRIDYLGMILIATGFSALMVWMTFLNTGFDLFSWQSIALASTATLALILSVIVELRVKEPVIPMELFKNRTFSLSVIASISSGVVVMATVIFFAQYMQISRGHSPTSASVFSIPMVFGMLVMSAVVGILITRTGHWKRYIVAGSIAALAGFVLISQLRVDTPYWYVIGAMLVLGVGAGMSWQNLVLIVQNTVSPRLVGTATASIMFFFTLGGSMMTTVMGKILEARVGSYLTNFFTELEANVQEKYRSLLDGQIPDTAALPDHIQAMVESAYGAGVGDTFLAVTPLALITVIACILMPNIPLQTQLPSVVVPATVTKGGKNDDGVKPSAT